MNVRYAAAMNLSEIETLDAVDRLRELKTYLPAADEKVRKARNLRATTVAELRKALTWRELAVLTGLTEQHLRREVGRISRG